MLFFLSARRVRNSSSGLSSTRSMTLSLISPRLLVDRLGVAVYLGGHKGVAVVLALANPVGRVAPVRQGDHGEQERQRHEHYGRYTERHCRQDDRNQGVGEEDADPGYLVPERLQGVEAHPRGAVLVDEPDYEGPERHQPHERGEHAQVRQHGPRSLVSRTHLAGRAPDRAIEVAYFLHLSPFVPALALRPSVLGVGILAPLHGLGYHSFE